MFTAILASVEILVWSINSCGFARVVFQESPKPFATLQRALALYISADHRKEHTPPNVVVERVSGSAKPARREAVDMQAPVACRYTPACHCHPTLPGMRGPTLRRDQGVEGCQPGEQRLVPAPGMMQPLPGAPVPLPGVVSLVSQGAGRWPLRVCKESRPARLLGLQPAPYPLASGRPCRVGDVIDQVA